MSIQDELNQIKSAVYGADVRDAIHDSIKKTYDDASANGNANMEVEMARGTEPTLNDRLGKMDDKDQEVTAQLAEKAFIDQPTVSFTFDDGLTADATTYALFEEYGYKASFGLIADRIYNSDRNPIDNYIAYQNAGHEIMSHSNSHPYMDGDLSPYDLVEELESPVEQLTNLGFNVNGFIVPYSVISENNLAKSKEVYDYTLIGGTGYNTKETLQTGVIERVSTFTLGLEGSKNAIDEAIDNKKMLVFYDHGVGNTGSFSLTDYRSLLDYVALKQQENKISVLTVRELVKKYRDSPISLNSKDLTNSFTTDFYSDTWEFAENTLNLSKTFISDSTRQLTISDTSNVGDRVVMQTTVRALLKNLGGKARFNINVAFSNSQFSFFDVKLKLEFLDTSLNVLTSKTKPVYPENDIERPLGVDLYLGTGNNMDDATRIRASLIIELKEALTVPNYVTIKNIEIKFPTGDEYIDLPKNLTLLNGWANHNVGVYGESDYYIDRQRVYLSGYVNGVGATGSVILQLPPGIAPKTRKRFLVSETATLDVNVDGSMTIAPAEYRNVVRLDGVSFRMRS